MKVTGNWLRQPGAQAVLTMLEGAGHQACFVGGCVRNDLLGAPVADIDIATSATPDRVTDLAGAAGFKVIPTGIDHGTVTVIAHDQPYEVTSFRRDIETDGRHAKVTFSARMEDDAMRRDFTMNALYATARGDVIDPVGGLEDLAARQVRFVGDAARRIAEDALRILRFFRFHAWYGDPSEGLDAEGLAACAEGADGMARLSAERIGAEMLKLLSAPDPAPSLAPMAQAGILSRILPGADLRPLAPLVSLETELGVSPDPLRRLAVIGGEDVSARFRLSKKQTARLDLLRDGIANMAGAAEIAWRHGAEVARDVELLRAATFGAPLPADLAARIAQGAAATFPISPKDLMPGYKGPALGARLRVLESRWIASGMTATRADLLD